MRVTVSHPPRTPFLQSRAEWQNNVVLMVSHFLGPRDTPRDGHKRSRSGNGQAAGDEEQLQVSEGRLFGLVSGTSQVVPTEAISCSQRPLLHQAVFCIFGWPRRLIQFYFHGLVHGCTTESRDYR